MSPIIPSRYGHPKYNVFPQKSRAASLGGFKSNQRGTPGVDSKARRKQKVDDTRLAVQTAEDDEMDNFFSKQLAAARFQNNHRLINTLFNETVVELDLTPDSERSMMCKKRILNLEDYQKKLDQEIAEISRRFSENKERIHEEGIKFNSRLANFIDNSKLELERAKVAAEINYQQNLIIKDVLKNIVDKVDDE